MLEVKNIHKKFGTNEVLKGVDFKFEKGSVVLERQPFSAVSAFWSRQIKEKSPSMISTKISLLLPGKRSGSYE